MHDLTPLPVFKSLVCQRRIDEKGENASQIRQGIPQEARSSALGPPSRPYLAHSQHAGAVDWRGDSLEWSGPVGWGTGEARASGEFTRPGGSDRNSWGERFGGLTAVKSDLCSLPTVQSSCAAHSC